MQELERHVDTLTRERLVLAKLAADEPLFASPIATCGARAIRDDVLRGAGLLR